MRQSVLAIKDLANRAGQGISMNPERMGADLLQECECGLNAFLAQIPEELQDEYEKRYIAKYSEWLHAMKKKPQGAMRNNVKKRRALPTYMKECENAILT
jgi:hypothetical protein